MGYDVGETVRFDLGSLSLDLTIPLSRFHGLLLFLPMTILQSPHWCYSCGLDEGYIPQDPRRGAGACQTMAGKYNFVAPASVPFQALQPWMTGGSGAGNIVATEVASYSQWPPASLNNVPIATSLNVALLPQYTATATDLVLTAGSPTPTTTNPSPTPILHSPYYTPAADCSYTMPW